MDQAILGFRVSAFFRSSAFGFGIARRFLRAARVRLALDTAAFVLSYGRTMNKLEPPDTHCFLAAMGWLELGNAAEAKAELAQVSAEQQEHPDVLEVRWSLAAEQKCWEEALEIARALLRRAPKRSSGWLHQAYALRRVPDGSVQKAWEALLPASNKFPKELTIPFNLACYACQMGQLVAAREWLLRAVAIGGKEKVIGMALNDSDVAPLWDEIRQL
jgi:predicted Zn-dependent protease